jgi:hypothetical protein
MGCWALTGLTFTGIGVEELCPVSRHPSEGVRIIP